MDFSRAMFVTVLAKIDGADVSGYAGSSFDDVEAGKWYSQNVEWAYQNGYASGLDERRGAGTEYQFFTGAAGSAARTAWNDMTHGPRRISPGA